MPNDGIKKPGTALVTGCSSGIGRAIALELADAGYRVHAGVRKESDAAALRAEGKMNLAPIMLDVADEGSIAAAVAAIGAETGEAGLAVLVNNAGFALAGPLELQPVAELRAQFEVNTIGVVALTQACIPLLRKAKGRIVTISSTSGISSMPFQGGYCASKHAVEALMAALRVELRPWGIQVCSVLPGDIRTPAWGKALAAADAMIAGWSAEGRALYGPAVETVRQMAATPRGIPPERVAVQVRRLLDRRRMPARSLAGPDAPFYALLEVLPARLRDAIVASQLPAYGRTAS